MRTRRQWARRITASWHVARAVAVIRFMQVGQELLDAKADLAHGEWLKLIESLHENGELPFKKRVAQDLMKIAGCPAFSKASTRRFLPPDYSTICKLETLYRRFPDTFTRLIEDGTINPSLQRNEVSKLLRLDPVDQRGKHEDEKNEDALEEV
jgi:hypothetical protein